ncbi:MAG: ABC transporter ATP-binding protein [Coriobacteriales bacterium]
MGVTSALEVQDLTCGYGGTPVVEGLSFSIPRGQVCCLLGANGIGKTTVFKTVMGSLPALGGQVLVGGQSTAGMSRAKLARMIGYVPQAHTPPFPYTVADVVEMGRSAHVPLAGVPSARDRELAMEALNALGIAHLYKRPYTDISGGERQMVLIARALAQQARLLIMDEPTSSLDFGNQARVLACIRQLAQAGLSVLMTTHYPDHVFQCADSVVVIKERAEHTAGRPRDVLTPQLLQEIYGIPAAVAQVDAGLHTATVTVPIEEPDPARAKAIGELIPRG